MLFEMLRQSLRIRRVNIPDKAYLVPCLNPKTARGALLGQRKL